MSIIKLLTIRKQNYEKDFYLEGYVYPGSSYDIPLKTGEFSHYISINIEESEHYTDDEFLDFLSNMSISFRMEFINKIITKLKQQIETTKFHKKDYVALKLFSGTKFETLKKFHVN